MKTFWKVFIVIAMIFVICACPEDDKPSGGSGVPVGAVAITIDGTPVTASYTINVGQTVTLAASASGASTYSLQQTAGTASGTTFGGSGANLTITGNTAGTYTIRVNANNATSGNFATFTLIILPKLTGFNIYHFQTRVHTDEYEVEANYDEEFSIHVIPENAQSEFNWSFNPATGVNVTKQTDKWILKAATPGDYTVTVSPAQKGLTASDIDHLKRTFTLKFETMSPQPVVSFHIENDSGHTVTEDTVDRGYSKTFTAIHNVPFVITTWSTSNANVASVEDNGSEVIVTATEDSAGGTATITASARNRWNTAGTTIPQTLVVTVPEKGNVVFEWKATNNLTEETLKYNSVRNYPGFRDVWIASIGSAATTGDTHYNRVGAGGFEDNVEKDFVGARVGSSFALNGNQGNPRFVIGTEVNRVGDDVTGPKVVSTSTTDTDVGTLDLSKPVRLTLGFANYNFGGWFRIYVNNNGTGSGTSNLGAASQIKHYTLSAGQTFVGASTMDGRSGIYETIIDFSNDSMYRGHGGGADAWTAWAGLNNTQKAQLQKAFIGFGVAGNNNENWINLTHIKLEYITVAYVNIAQEADFAGFPDTITTDALTVNLTGSGYATAKWYVNGLYQTGKDGLSFTLAPSTYGLVSGGKYSLTAVVTVGGQVYSKTAHFTVQ